jgi:NAD kinase
MLPRAVIVERPTEYRELLARHGTREQARFFLAQRDIRITELQERHLRYEETRAAVLNAVPATWRTATVARAELDRFLFADDVVVVVLGQDGLVANVAKYLRGQPVVGLNPDPERIAGALVRHAPAAAADLLADVAASRARLEARTMARAALDDGQELLALNEIFVGHASHQSARYTLAVGESAEHQSSSGLIVATGTGATGWATSINRQRRDPVALPAPTDPQLAWFVREPWPSVATGATLTGGLVGPGGAPAHALRIVNELGSGAVAFGDGIEADHLALDWGQRLTITTAQRTLNLVAG